MNRRRPMYEKQLILAFYDLYVYIYDKYNIYIYIYIMFTAHSYQKSKNILIR